MALAKDKDTGKGSSTIHYSGNNVHGGGGTSFGGGSSSDVTSGAAPSISMPTLKPSETQQVITGSTPNSSSSGGSYGGYPSISYPGLDLSVYDRLISSAYSSADAARLSLTDAYNAAMKSLGDVKQGNKEAFGQGRSSINENSYDRSMANQNDLAARGLAGSGLEQLGDVQESMAKGNEVSTLANEYYNAQNEIANEEVNAANQKTSSEREIEAALEQNVANIELAKWQEQNAYNQMIAEAQYQAAVNSYNASQSSTNADDLAMQQYRESLANGLAYMSDGYTAEMAAKITGADINELTNYARMQEDSSAQSAKNSALASIYAANQAGNDDEAQYLSRIYNYSYPNATLTEDDLSLVGITAPSNKPFFMDAGGLINNALNSYGYSTPSFNSGLSDFYKNYGLK